MKIIIDNNTITTEDGVLLYTEQYLLTMMQREHQRGFNEGLKEPVLHKVEVVSLDLHNKATECLDALQYWDKNEFKCGITGHTLDGMRPMILMKKILTRLLQ